MSGALFRAWRYIDKANLGRVVVRMGWVDDQRGKPEYVPQVVAAWDLDGKPQHVQGWTVLAELVSSAAYSRFGGMNNPVMLTPNALVEVAWEPCTCAETWDCADCSGFGHRVAS